MWVQVMAAVLGSIALGCGLGVLAFEMWGSVSLPAVILIAAVCLIVVGLAGIIVGLWMGAT